MPEWLSGRRMALLAGGLWTACVIVALVITLPSVRHDDFDGLNNLWQIPFALPWFLIPLGTDSNVTDAWIAAGLGVLNAALVYRWIAHRSTGGAVARD